MKKLLVITLAILLMLSLASCNGDGKDENTDNSSDDSYSVLPPTPGSTSDDGDVTTPDDSSSDEDTTPVTPPESSGPISFTSADKTVYVKLENVNVRNAPYVDNSTLVATLHYGHILACTGESESWYRVTYDGKECYIAKSNVTTDNISGNDFTERNDTVYITTDAANIRRGPSMDTEIMGSLKKGDSLIRIGINESWSRVSYDGGEYYISNSVLSTTPPAAS